MAPFSPAPALSSPGSLYDLLFWGWRVPPILVHMCGVGAGKCLRRSVRPGLLADPAVLSHPHCPPPPSSLQGAHPAAAGTTQPGPTLAPMSPSSGEVEFNLFFPDGLSRTSTKGPRPTTAQTYDVPGTLLSFPTNLPYLRVLGKAATSHVLAPVPPA